MCIRDRLQFALEHTLLGAGKEGAAHDQQFDVGQRQRRDGLHQFVDALVRVKATAVKDDEILIGKAQLGAQLSLIHI